MAFNPNPSLETAPPPPRKPMTGARVTGMCFLALWCALIFGLIWFLYTSWDPEFFDKYAPKYWSGLKITVQLVLLALFLGATLSLPLAIGRLSKNGFIRTITACYVEFFRGTPLIAQIFLIYYGFGQFFEFWKSVGLWWFFRDAWYCALLSFTLNTAAYQAVILSGAIKSVPKGQTEGAQSLGIGQKLIFFKIILPQAMIVALRPYGNEIILMIKGSAIVSIITVFDLMGETRRAFSQTFDFQTYLWAAVVYLLIVETIRNIWDVVEHRLTRHLKR